MWFQDLVSSKGYLHKFISREIPTTGEQDRECVIRYSNPCLKHSFGIIQFNRPASHIVRTIENLLLHWFFQLLECYRARFIRHSHTKSHVIPASALVTRARDKFLADVKKLIRWRRQLAKMVHRFTRAKVCYYKRVDTLSSSTGEGFKHYKCAITLMVL